MEELRTRTLPLLADEDIVDAEEDDIEVDGEVAEDAEETTDEYVEEEAGTEKKADPEEGASEEQL